MPLSLWTPSIMCIGTTHATHQTFLLCKGNTNCTDTKSRAAPLLRLKHGLSSLPKPKGDYDIIVPEVEEDTEADGVKSRLPPGFIEDQQDVDERTAEQRRADDDAEFKRQSQAVQRGLPLPTSVNRDVLRHGAAKTEEQASDEAIVVEMLAMLSHDLGQDSGPYERFDDDSIAAARELLAAESAAVAAAAGIEDLATRHAESWLAVRDDIMFVPSKGRYGRVSLHTKKDVVEEAEQEYSRLRAAMTKDFKKGVKLEKKLKLALGGYQVRHGVSFGDCQAHMCTSHAATCARPLPSCAAVSAAQHPTCKHSFTQITWMPACLCVSIPPL